MLARKGLADVSNCQAADRQQVSAGCLNWQYDFLLSSFPSQWLTGGQGFGRTETEGRGARVRGASEPRCLLC